MPRTARHVPGGMIFHVLNRGNGRDEIFSKEEDYAAFEKILLETQEQVFVRILSDCLMPNHWHLVLWPLHDGDLGRFMQRLTTTHVRRWHLHHHSVGTGHLYTVLRTSNATPSDRRWSSDPSSGVGAVCGAHSNRPRTWTSPSFALGQFPARRIGSPE